MDLHNAVSKANGELPNTKKLEIHVQSFIQPFMKIHGNFIYDENCIQLQKNFYFVMSDILQYS